MILRWWNQHGVALACPGRYADAIESLNYARKIEPDFSKAQSNLEHAVHQVRKPKSAY